MNIAFIGGGPIAKSLAALAQAAGHKTVLGVRTPSKLDGSEFDHASFEEALRGADVAVIAIPYFVVDEVLPGLAPSLAGKIVVDASNPVAKDWSPILTGEESSGGEHIASLLPQSRVVKAFNSIFADVLRTDRLDREGHKVTQFVASDDQEAKTIVIDLGKQFGLAPVNAGPLKSARYLEGMAHLNIELAAGQGGGTNAAFVYNRVA